MPSGGPGPLEAQAGFALGASISVPEENTGLGRLTFGSQTGRVADNGIVARARIGVDARRQAIAAAPPAVR